MFEVLLLIFGFISIVLKRTKEKIFIIFLLLISPIPDSLTGGGHYARSSFMLIPLIIIEGIGAVYLLSSITKIKIKIVKYTLSGLTFLIVIFGLFNFFVNYITFYKDFYSIHSHYGYKDLMTDVYAKKDNYDRIYISKHLYDTKQYIFYLFFNNYDPIKYQNKINVTYSKESDGWVSIDRIDNIYFVQNLPSINKNSKLAKKNILFVSNPVDFSEKMKVEGLIKDKLGNVLFKEVKLKEVLRMQSLETEIVN